MTAPEHVLVTGASGFVGRHVIPALLERGVDVTAVARDEAKARALPWFERVRFVAWDLHRNPDDAPAQVLAPHDAVIHLAWTGLPNYESSHHIDDNVHLDVRFLTAITKIVPRILVAGTCFEYGCQSGRLSEDYPVAPCNHYAMAKDMVRRCLEALQKLHPFALQWARLFYMYGPGQNPKSLIAQLDRAIDSGAPSFNMSAGEQLRDFSPVSAIAEKIVALAMTDADGVFNICSGTPISVKQLVEQHIAKRGARIALNLGYYDYPENEAMAFWGDDRKLNSLLAR